MLTPRHRQFRFQGGVFFGKGSACGIHETNRIILFVIWGIKKCARPHII